MGKYIVTQGQNIYDVALHIYGSIEGVVDLFMNNEWLSFDYCLKQDDVLVFTDGFVIDAGITAYNNANEITPSNGERHVYYKEPSFPKLFEIRLSNKETSCFFSITGSGKIEIDWGDNADIQENRLENNELVLSHSFDNSIAKNGRIRVYGEFSASKVDFTGLNAMSILLLRPVAVKHFILNNSTLDVGFISLLENTHEIDLSGLRTSSLLPLLALKEIRQLNLCGIKILTEKLDEYLIQLVKKHYQRRTCTIKLAMQPSGEYREPERDEDNNYILNTGMEAVWLLVNEPSWNEGGNWKFIINTPKSPKGDLKNVSSLNFVNESSQSPL